MPVELMFNYERMKPDVSWVAVSLFALYAPVGVAVVVIRLLACIMSLSVLRLLPNAVSARADRFLGFFLFPLLGWLPWVTGRRTLAATTNPKVIVSNHASNFVRLPPRPLPLTTRALPLRA